MGLIALVSVYLDLTSVPGRRRSTVDIKWLFASYETVCVFIEKLA